MKSPTVSVVMSVYNGIPFLNVSVDSILQQTLHDFEFIIIDDGSVDGTWDSLSSYALRDRRIKLLRNSQNIGYTKSLNKGIECARANYIARQDADDISLPQRLERQLTFLEENPRVGLLGTLPHFINSSGERIVSISYVNITDNPSIQRQLLDSNCFRHGSVMIRRRYLDEVGLYDPDLEPSEDYDLWLRLAEVTEVANLAEPLYQYREHDSSVSYARRFRQMYNKALALERAIYRRYGPEPAMERFGHVGRDYLRTTVIGCANNQLEEAKEPLQRAIRFDPTILERREPLETIVTKYTPRNSIEDSLTFTESLFQDLLPSNRTLAKMKSRLLSRLHIAEAFKGVELSEPDRVAAHLWPGIRHDPSWLRNRGVVSLAIKQIFGRGQTKGSQRSTS